MLDKIKSFLDEIFKPPISFLDMARERLAAVSQITGRGLDVKGYLSVFGDLPGPWQMVISSLLSVTVLLISLIIFRSVMRIYYATKEGVKWW